MRTDTDHFIALRDKLKTTQAVVGVCGLGYVGLPLVKALVSKEFAVIGFDVDNAKVDQLKAGRSYIKHVPSDEIAHMVRDGRFAPTTDFSRVPGADVVVLCVPTPLSKHREPDLSYLVDTARSVARHQRAGQLIVLESTTYPGTTAEVLRPIFEKRGFTLEKDFFLAFSPEREDPTNTKFQISNIPKVVGADGERSFELAALFYARIVSSIVAVSSSATAEAVKLTENIFRAVNIALVNELKVIFTAMGIDVWEVIDAAKTKPFGFMEFYPGPGLGGHCIPVDPFYLTWKAREYEITTRFIELAGQINRSMPQYVLEKLIAGMDRNLKRSLNGAKILLLGVAYKKNVDDIRESPSLKLIEMIESRGAAVDYFDPLIPVIPMTREHGRLADRRSITLNSDSLERYDAIVIATDHDNVDYELVMRHGKLVVDTRNVCARMGLGGQNLIKA